MSPKIEDLPDSKSQTAADQASPTPTTQATKADKTSRPEKTTTDSNTGLPPELLELVEELRDMVKGINPKKHTVKTLRRLLSNVGDILADIERLYDRLNHKS